MPPLPELARPLGATRGQHGLNIGPGCRPTPRLEQGQHVVGDGRQLALQQMASSALVKSMKYSTAWPGFEVDTTGLALGSDQFDHSQASGIGNCPQRKTIP